MFEFTALTTAYLVIVGLSGVLSVFVVKWLFRVDTKWEAKQRMLIALSAELVKLGFKHLAKLAEALAIKDFSGAWGEFKHLVQTMLDPTAAMAMLEENFYIQLAERLARDADRPRILKAITDLATAQPEMVKAAGLALVAKT
jgi:hypothetical protein